jgi:hypothetical protein
MLVPAYEGAGHDGHETQGEHDQGDYDDPDLFENHARQDGPSDEGRLERPSRTPPGPVMESIGPPH